MTGLSVAIGRRDWEATALYLVLGVIRVASRLPPGTVEDLLDMLTGAQRGGGER
jgi:hypothetical protein